MIYYNMLTCVELKSLKIILNQGVNVYAGCSILKTLVHVLVVHWSFYFLKTAIGPRTTGLAQVISSEREEM
jgi:hypothetical protein